MAKTFISLQLNAALIAASLAFGTPASADAVQRRQGGTAPANSARCTQLTHDLDELSKSLAMNFAEGIGERSAPRATMREAQYSNLLNRVRMTMDLMRDSRCRMPASVPTGQEYVDSALTCHTDMLRAEMDRATTLPESCNRSRWVPAGR